MSTLTASPVLNKNYSITNNSGVDIVVLDASSGGAQPVARQLYEQTLKVLSSTSGQTVIKAGHTGTVVLNNTHVKADGTQGYSMLYNLIIAKADNLHPVQAEGVVLDFKSQSYLPLTLDAAAYKNMQLAENFQQTIMAYPASTLSKDYQAALSGSSNSGSATSIAGPVTSFFASTKQYQAVTLNMAGSISTYYSQFPYVWAGYTPSKTYYLYSSDGSACTYGGSLQISVPSAIPASTDKSLPGFTFLFTDAGNNTKNLFYKNGQFVDDAGSDTPAICLMGQFLLKSQLSKNQADNMVVAVLAGTANGIKMLGYDEKQEQNSDGSWSGLFTLLHPKNAMGWLQLLMTASGVLMGVDFAWKAVKGLIDMVKGYMADNNDAVPATNELQDIKQQISDLQVQMKETGQQLLNKLEANVQVPADLPAATSALQTQTNNQVNEDGRAIAEASVANQENRLSEVTQYGVDDADEDAGDELNNDNTMLNDATTAQLPGVLPQVDKSLTNTNTVIANQENSDSAAMDASTKQDVQNMEQEYSENDASGKTNESNEEDASSGDTPVDVSFEAEF